MLQAHGRPGRMCMRGGIQSEKDSRAEKCTSWKALSGKGQGAAQPGQKWGGSNIHTKA